MNKENLAITIALIGASVFVKPPEPIETPQADSNNQLPIYVIEGIDNQSCVFLTDKDRVDGMPIIKTLVGGTADIINTGPGKGAIPPLQVEAFDQDDNLRAFGIKTIEGGVMVPQGAVSISFKSEIPYHHIEGTVKLTVNPEGLDLGPLPEKDRSDNVVIFNFGDCVTKTSSDDLVRQLHQFQSYLPMALNRLNK